MYAAPKLRRPRDGRRVTGGITSRLLGEDKYAGAIDAIDAIDEQLSRGLRQFVVAVREQYFPVLGERLDVVTDLVVSRLQEWGWP